MHKELEQVIKRYLSKRHKSTDQMKSQASRLQEFIDFMIRVNWHRSIVTFQTRLEALQLAGSVCDGRESLEVAFKRAAINIDEASMKAIRAFDKVANYRHISEWLSRLAGSRKFRQSFQQVNFRFLDHYAPHMVLGRARFVHAEVQIVTFYRLEGKGSVPRVIGTTKAACYLCDLFLSFHPQYTISATHGTIFDAWTIPDILLYSQQDKSELRAIVRSMQTALVAQARKANNRFRPFPVQSGIYHNPSLPSLAGTVIASAPMAETASISTLRSITEDHNAVARLSVEPGGELVAATMSDRDAITPLADANGWHSEEKEEKSRLRQQDKLLHGSETSEQVDHKVVVDSNPACQSPTNAQPKAGREERNVQRHERTFGETNYGEYRPSQMRPPASACMGTHDWHGQQSKEVINGSPHRDTDSGRSNVTYRSCVHSGHPSTAPRPAQTQLNAGREPFEAVGQETRYISNGQSLKRRRKRHRKVYEHPDAGQNNQKTSRQRRDTASQGRKSQRHRSQRHRSQGHRSRGHSSRGHRSQGHRSQAHTRHANRKKSSHRSSRRTYSFLQRVRRAIRGALRLFCV